MEKTDVLAQMLPHARVSGLPTAGWFGIVAATFEDYERNREHCDAEGGLGPTVHNEALCPFSPDLSEVQHFRYLAAWKDRFAVAPAILECLTAAGAEVGDEKVDWPLIGIGRSAGNVPLCISTPEFYQFIRSPMFIAQNIPDLLQLRQFGFNSDPFADVPLSRTPSGQHYVSYYRSQMGEQLFRLVMNGPKTDGLFAPGCAAHCLGWNEDSVVLGGLKLFEVFGNWYFQRTGPSRLLADFSATSDAALTTSCADDVMYFDDSQLWTDKTESDVDCIWTLGDGAGTREVLVGEAATHTDCIEQVRFFHPDANGATMDMTRAASIFVPAYGGSSHRDPMCASSRLTFQTCFPDDTQMALLCDCRSGIQLVHHGGSCKANTLSNRLPA